MIAAARDVGASEPPYWVVVMTDGQTWHLRSHSPSAAMLTAIELSGLNVSVVRCCRRGEW